MTTLDLDFHCDTLFTKVFYAVSEAKTRYVVIYGGSGSSKSYSVHQHELFQIMEPGRGDTLVVRKIGASLRHSCYKLFRHLIDEYELSEQFDWAYSGDNRHITCLETGRKLVFMGVDDPEKLKSIVAFKRIIIEEADQLKLEDFMELNRRARGMKDIQVILILNPTSENHWIKTKLCDLDGPYNPETTVLRFTYHDNCNRSGTSFLTEGDILNFERIKEMSENDYRIFVLAEWGVDDRDRKYCLSFSMAQSIATQYDETQVLWATFDFNVDPLTCIVAQVFARDETIRAIECIQLPNSDIYKMCDRLLSAYPEAVWMVTGDATGKNRSALSRDNLNYFQIIRNELQLNPQQIVVPRSNPAVEYNRVLLNALHNNWTVEIDPVRCKPLIHDLTYVEVDGEGKIKKDRSSNKKFADFLDAWRYLVNVVNAQLGNRILRRNTN